MKIKLFLILFLLFSSLEAKKIVLTPTVGKQISTPSKDFKDDELLIGVGIRGYLSKDYAVEFDFASSNSNLMGDGGKSDLERGSINLYYDAFSDSKVSPYIIIGGGYEKLHRTYQDIKSQPFYQAGIGIRMDLSKKVELSTQLKYLKKTKTKTDEYIASLGVGMIFSDECETKLAPTKKISSKTYQNLKKQRCFAKPAIKSIDKKQTDDQNFIFCDEVSYVKKSKNLKKRVKKAFGQKAKDANYIQVASLSKKKNVKKTIKVLKSYGLKIKTIKHKNLTTILVGPYDSFEISSVYKRVKSFQKDAFYKKL